MHSSVSTTARNHFLHQATFRSALRHFRNILETPAPLPTTRKEVAELCRNYQHISDCCSKDSAHYRRKILHPTTSLEGLPFGIIFQHTKLAHSLRCIPRKCSSQYISHSVPFKKPSNSIVSAPGGTCVDPSSAEQQCSWNSPFPLNRFTSDSKSWHRYEERFASVVKLRAFNAAQV